MNPENICGYLLPAGTTPAAKKYLKEEQLFFCDYRLQNLIALEVSGQSIIDKNIDCCSEPQECPNRIGPLSFSINR